MSTPDKDGTRDTPRCNALESNPLDSFDYRAWVTLARQLERELAIEQRDHVRAMKELVAENERARGHSSSSGPNMQELRAKGFADVPQPILDHGAYPVSRPASAVGAIEDVKALRDRARAQPDQADYWNRLADEAQRSARGRGNYDPNESPEALAARLEKVGAFVAACNSRACPVCGASLTPSGLCPPCAANRRYAGGGE